MSESELDTSDAFDNFAPLAIQKTPPECPECEKHVLAVVSGENFQFKHSGRYSLCRPEVDRGHMLFIHP